MRTRARFVLALFAVILLNGSVFSSPPRHPGVCTKNDDLGYTFITEGELKKSTVVAKNGSEFQRFLLEVPSVSFSYKGKTYDVGGSSVNVVAKWDSLPDGAAASYHRDYLKEGYQLKLDNVCRDWLIKKLIGDDCDVRNNVLHEVTHYLVDLKYNGDAESPEYRFVQEMMAHMNGGNMTEMQAAKRIAERYPKLKILANEFLESNFVGEEAEKVNSSSKQKAKDMLLGVKKNPIEENVCHVDSESVKEDKATDVADANSMNLAGEVGVRGWCDCGDDHGKRYIVGDMFCMYDKLECDLAYTLCGRCGCVVRPKDCTGEGLQIVDVRLYKELKRKNGGKLAWLDAFGPLKARQSKIEAIPNGQVVVGELCTCKVADPISVGFTNKITGEFYVCCNCGRVREPDENGDVPSGPTALSEMGLNEQAEKESERIRNWLEKGKSSK